MIETKYNKFLTIFLIIIIVAIIGLVGYLGFNLYVEKKTAKDSEEFVSSFVEPVEVVGNVTNEPNTAVDNSNEASNEASISNSINETEISSGTSSTKKTYKGFNVIGTIEIPKTNIKYPVLQDPPTVKSLEVAVVALYPKDTVLNTIGNVVIVGHNYRNGLFFSNNKKLTAGDKIYITDLNGNKVTYKVYNVFQARQDDTSFYNRDTDGKMEITLSSCTDASNDQRIIVQAKAE